MSTQIRTFEEIQEEILFEQQKLLLPLPDDEMESVLRKIIDLLEERKGAING